jgi:hypothetical protein
VSTPSPKRTPARAKASKPPAGAAVETKAPAATAGGAMAPEVAPAPPPAAAKAADADRNPDLPIVQVRSKRPQGRRRSGIAFGPEPVPVDTALLSPRELDALLGDPELIVEPRLP